MVNPPAKQVLSGNTSIIVEDGATPFFNVSKQRANLLAASCTRKVSQIFKEKVQKGFEEGSARAQPNTPATLEWKRWLGGRGFLGRPLIASGALESAIKKPEITMSEANFMWLTQGAGGMAGKSIVSVTWYLPTAGQNVYLPQQVRKNPDFVYLWSQENGAKGSRMFKFGLQKWGKFKVPERPFLNKALKSAFQESLVYTTSEVNGFYKWMKAQEYKPTNIIPSANMERELRWGPRDLMMMVAPPSMAYAGIGGGLDFFNILKGQFSFRNYEQWVVQMGKGKLGMTRLSQRRQIRKRVWK
jgi:hypothetical protein